MLGCATVFGGWGESSGKSRPDSGESTVQIRCSIARAKEIAVQAYPGASDVITETRQPTENPYSLNWWRSDESGQRDRGFRGRRDYAGLHAYLSLGTITEIPIEPNRFPPEFFLNDGIWCRPDKGIVKVALRHQLLTPIERAGEIEAFEATTRAMNDLERLGLSPIIAAS